METVSLYIRNLDKGLHLRIKQEAKEKGYSMNEYILKLLEENDPLERGEKLLAIWDKLEEFFQRKVDLLTLSSLRNPILKKNIGATKVLLNDGKRQEVSF